VKLSARTPEREAMLRAEYPEAMDTGDLRARLNALPGPPFTADNAVRMWARALEVRKTPEAIDAMRRNWSAAGGKATAAVYAGERGVRDFLRWTSDRIALIRSDYADATDATAFLARLNALPGQPIPRLDMVSMRAMRLGVSKTAEAKLAIGSQCGKRCVSLGTLKRKTPTPRTAEREAVLRAEYPTAPSNTAELLATLNAMPGPPLKSTRALSNWAQLLGVKKVRVARPPKAPKEKAAREKKPQAYKPKAPEMRRKAIPLPVVREPAPPIESLSLEQQAAIADAALARKYDLARKQLSARGADPMQVAAAVKIRPHEAFRLLAEMRGARA